MGRGGRAEGTRRGPAFGRAAGPPQASSRSRSPARGDGVPSCARGRSARPRPPRAGRSATPPARGGRRPARPRRRRREPPIVRASSASRTPPWHGASWRKYHAVAEAGKPAQLAPHLVRVATSAGRARGRAGHDAEGRPKEHDMRRVGDAGPPERTIDVVERRADLARDERLAEERAHAVALTVDTDRVSLAHHASEEGIVAPRGA